MASLPFHVKAVYDYHSDHDEDLSFPIGQIITVTEIEDDDWYVGQYTDSTGGKQDGLFPKIYVEKYEPPAPPRPSRPKKEAAPAAEPEIAAAKVEPPLESTAVEVPQPPTITSQPEIEKPEPVAPTPVRAEPPPAAPKPQAAKPGPVPAAKEAAPEPAPKPSANSFKDRIAAFNKPAAPPVAPKPSNVGGPGSFIKKPFVAPPPSRNAYIPPVPREAAQAQKIYRREEDPEIAETQAQAQRDAEAAGLTAGDDEAEEEAPKATSLKDRIAMLQKQQQEQAARRAEGGGAEKPKRPSKPRTESTDRQEASDDESIEQGTLASPEQGAESPAGLAPQSSVRRPSHQSLELPPREVSSDGNDADQSGAGETTEDAGASSTEIDEHEEHAARGRAVPPPAVPSRTSMSGTRDPVAKEIQAEEQQEEDDEIDEETRRKEELRARMAKMSGGMGMAGFFAPGPKPPAKKPSAGSEHRTQSNEPRSPPPAQRVPMVPIPGIGGASKVQSPETEDPAADVSVPGAFAEAEDDLPSASAPPVPQERPLPPQPPVATQSRGAPPVPPTERPVPLPTTARPAPPPPPHAPDSSDDNQDQPTPVADDDRQVPMPPINTDLPSRPLPPMSPPSKRHSQVSTSAGPLSPSEKRMSRMPPPVPGSAPQSATAAPEGRAPPPPPGIAPPSRSATIKETAKRAGDGESDYEGDYDTDIASAVPHKEALKAHERAPSIDEETLSEDTSSAQPILPPPVPPTQRAAPPPPPHQAPVRKSTDTPRAPPPPPPRTNTGGTEDDYDPYNYDAMPPAPSRKARMPSDIVQESDPSLYEVSPQDGPRRVPPPALPAQPPPQRHAVPPPLPPEHTAPVLPPVTALERQSTDLSRKSMDARRSMDPNSRPIEGASVARDVDLGETTMWWTQPDAPPPVFQNRPDVLYEMEESSTSKRGGRTTISRDVYVLFQDYSQTIVTARFDSKDPSANVQLEQRHEPPPARLRQDQLEAAHTQFGDAIAAAAAQKQNSTIGDGAPQSFIVDLINTAAPGALKPVGTRAYGVLVYANMANASVQQYDEIRPGDIVSFRNARFQGKHGAMHAKYSLDVGRPEHVAVVMEWDGTKKKIRAWEQGREKERKVKVESFKVGDLRSGEVKVWRVVGRSWIGWDGN